MRALADNYCADWVCNSASLFHLGLNPQGYLLHGAKLFVLQIVATFNLGFGFFLESVARPAGGHIGLFSPVGLFL
jgi:hypothetical protein